MNLFTKTNLRKSLKTLMLSGMALAGAIAANAQVCTTTYTAASPMPSGGFTVAAGQVVCIDESFTHEGDIVVSSGGMLWVKDGVTFSNRGATSIPCVGGIGGTLKLGVGSFYDYAGTMVLGGCSCISSTTTSTVRLRTIGASFGGTFDNQNPNNSLTITQSVFESPWGSDQPVVIPSSALSSPGCTGPLPVSYASMEATEREGKINIRWATSNELNNDRFEVQRASSPNAKPELVSTIKGAGNSNALMQYAAQDLNPMSGVSYYRVVQYNNDGKASASHWLQVNVNDFSSRVYPNPAKDFVAVQVRGKAGNQTTITLSDASGRVVRQESVGIDGNGSKNLSLDLSSVEKGIYFVKVISGNSSSDHKIVLTK